jgi:hypothetical protein
VFILVTAAHLRVRSATGASAAVLVLAIGTAGTVLLTFLLTDLIHEPASMATLLLVLAASIGLDAANRRN